MCARWSQEGEAIAWPLLLRALGWTVYHWLSCPMCRGDLRALFHDLRLSELRYLARIIREDGE